MQNVEIKIELRDPALARVIASGLRVASIVTLDQTDTYYRLAEGRLKKRETTDGGGHTYPPEYIFYHRNNEAKSRVSKFVIYSESEARKYFGASEPPVWVRVRKRREVFMCNGVRVHMDQVEGLGHFLELEALVTPQHNLAKAYASVDELRRLFGPALGEPVSAGYSDMLAADQG
jgi:adenylate cyclase class 2